jgi:hypothetical protein
LLAVFLGFRVCTGVFLIEQCLLERETDTKTSPTLDSALPRGNASRTGGFNILLCILRMRPALTSTEDHVPPFGCFWFASRLIPRTLSCFFGPAFHAVFFVCWRRWNVLGDPSCMVYWERQVADENEVTILMIINNLGSLNGPPWRFAPGSR